MTEDKVRSSSQCSMFNSMEYRSRNWIPRDDLLRERLYSGVPSEWKNKTKPATLVCLFNY